jgi:hypothetical protein
MLSFIGEHGSQIELVKKTAKSIFTVWEMPSCERKGMPCQDFTLFALA